MWFYFYDQGHLKKGYSVRTVIKEKYFWLSNLNAWIWHKILMTPFPIPLLEKLWIFGIWHSVVIRRKACFFECEKASKWRRRSCQTATAWSSVWTHLWHLLFSPCSLWLLLKMSDLVSSHVIRYYWLCLCLFFYKFYNCLWYFIFMRGNYVQLDINIAEIAFNDFQNVTKLSWDMNLKAISICIKLVVPLHNISCDWWWS